MVARTVVDLDSLLRPLASQPRALIPLTDLAEVWALEHDQAAELAVTLEDCGWLERWAGDDNPQVILSSRAAARLGIELWPPDTGDLVACKWLAIGAGRPAPPPRGVALETDVEASTMSQDGPHGFLDSRPDPRAADACREAWAPSIREASTVRPRHLLGTREIWPVGTDEAGRCWACHERRLKASDYCLVCDRTGATLALADLNATPERRPLPPLPDWLAGGRGRASPKKAAATEPKKKPKKKKAARNQIRAELNRLAAMV
jgi:hypothetical protein